MDTHGSPYFTMKLIKGENLASVIRKLQEGDPDYLENYTLDKLLLVFIKICNGVAFAHSKGVLHLDLKPENIQLGDFGEVIIMDWGLARVISEKDPDETESPKRSPPFSKTGPATASGREPRLYGAGTGGREKQRKGFPDRCLFPRCDSLLHADVPESSARHHAEGDADGNRHGMIEPPSKRAPDRIVPGGLEAVVMKAMAVRPADRYQGAKELRNDVLAFLSGHATMRSEPPRSRRRCCLPGDIGPRCFRSP